MIDRISLFFEAHAFGVCTSIADKFGVSTSYIRLLFIYASFFTLGSPFLLYLLLAVLMKLKRSFRRRTVWDI